MVQYVLFKVSLFCLSFSCKRTKRKLQDINISQQAGSKTTVIVSRSGLENPGVSQKFESVSSVRKSEMVEKLLGPTRLVSSLNGQQESKAKGGNFLGPKKAAVP